METSRITNVSSEPITALFTSSVEISSIKSEPLSENLQVTENRESSKPENNPSDQMEKVSLTVNHTEESKIEEEQQSLKIIQNNSECAKAENEKFEDVGSKDSIGEKVLEEEDITNNLSENGLRNDEENENMNCENEKEAFSHDFDDPLMEEIYDDDTELIF